MSAEGVPLSWVRSSGPGRGRQRPTAGRAAPTAGLSHHARIKQNPGHLYPYDLVDGRCRLAVDSIEELIVEKPFEIRLRVRDLVP